VQQDEEAQVPPDDISRESFLGGFGRVPSGLDPTQVYDCFFRMSARIRQLEERAREVSAPFLLEAVLREAAEVRTQSAQAAERTYNEIVQAAQQDGERLRGEAEQQASRMVRAARGELDDVRREADALLEQAREEAARIRREAEGWNQQAEQDLERLSVDYADFLQRLLERRKAFGVSEESGPSGPPVGAAAPAAASEHTGAPMASAAAPADVAPAEPLTPAVEPEPVEKMEPAAPLGNGHSRVMRPRPGDGIGHSTQPPLAASRSDREQRSDRSKRPEQEGPTTMRRRARTS
jgi:hypothetical protein